MAQPMTVQRLHALRAAGQTVMVKTGGFRVPRGAKQGWTLVRTTEEAVKKFIAKFEREGWTLESRPRVKLMNRWEGGLKPVLDTKGTTTLWIPEGTGIPEDHPWYVPDRDLYVVAAWFSRPPREARFWIPDDVYRRLDRAGKLPAGLKLAD